MRVDDARGCTVEIATPVRRIVCLVPSITETLFALGAGGRVVGITQYCVHPAEEVERCVRVGGTKNPDVSRVLSLRPDLVIANREENRRRDVERIASTGTAVWVTYARTVDEALREIGLLGRLLDREDAAGGIVHEVEAAREAARARAVPPSPLVVALVWKRPYMTLNADTFAHDLIRESGGANPFADRDRRYPRITEEELWQARPEVILLPTEPYAFGAADRIELLRLPCPASEAGRVHVVEGELLSWYGPRMGRAMRTFSELLYP